MKRINLLRTFLLKCLWVGVLLSLLGFGYGDDSNYSEILNGIGDFEASFSNAKHTIQQIEDEMKIEKDEMINSISDWIEKLDRKIKEEKKEMSYVKKNEEEKKIKKLKREMRITFPPLSPDERQERLEIIEDLQKEWDRKMKNFESSIEKKQELRDELKIVKKRIKNLKI